MPVDVSRLIGLTHEKEIENECNVTDLHIGWQNEDPAQSQADQTGTVHRAPLVSWVVDGQRRTFIPTLSFEPNTEKSSWLREFLGVEDNPEFKPDVKKLETDIRVALKGDGQN